MYSYDLAVSIVAYNTDPEDLTRLIRSVRSSGLRVLVTVVDNSPTDGLRQLIEGESSVYLRPGWNVGFGAAHNLAMRASLRQAPYQAVVNPDIVIGCGVWKTLCRFMDDHADIGQLMPAVVYPDGSEQRLTKRLPTPVDLLMRRFLGPLGRSLAPRAWANYEMRDLDMSVARDVPSLSGCFMLLRSEVLQVVGLFDERFFMYLEDVDLCRRIGEVSRTVFFPGVKVTHAYAKGSYRSGRLFYYHLSSAIAYFAKWGWLRDEKRQVRNRCDSMLSH